MSKLQEFLNKNKAVGIKKEVIISDRFKDENGDIMKFTIKSIDIKKDEENRAKASKEKKDGTFEIDGYKYVMKTIIECTVDPSFNDSKSLEETKVSSPEDYVRFVMLPGEINKLFSEIQKLNGFKTDINKLIEEAKN